MRTIDADDRIEFIKEVYCHECDKYNGVRCRACDIDDILEYIDNAPTIDQWHYPSRGEYPKENELALCLQSDGTIPFIGIYSNNKWFNWYTKFTYEFEPKCWQYIVPPKEEE